MNKRPRFVGIENILLLLAVLLFVVMALVGTWRAEYIAFQDYPSILLRAFIATHYDDPGYDFSNHFILNRGLIPNQGCDILLTLLHHLFSIHRAGKLLFSLYLVLLPMAAFYYLRGVNPENTAYTLLACTLTFHLFTAMFFLNFVLSIPVFLFFLGYWIRHRNDWSWKTLFIQAALLVTLYYFHMLTFGCALGAVLIHTLVEQKNLRSLYRSSLVFIPGLLLFFLWLLTMVMTKTVTESQLRVIDLYPSLGEKIKDLVEGISPCLLPTDHRAAFQFLFGAFALSMVVLGVFGNQDKETETARRTRKIWSWIIGLFFLTAILMSRWLVIYLPGPRVALIALFLAPVVFPKKKSVKYGFLCFLLLFTFSLRAWEIQYLQERSNSVAYAIAPFQEPLPAGERKGEMVLPLVLQPYTFYKPYHRVFDYYHILHGGVNPYHLMGPDFAVRYKHSLSAPPQYEPFPEHLSEEILRLYTRVLIFGKDGRGGLELMQHLARHGFREERGNRFTGVFTRK